MIQIAVLLRAGMAAMGSFARTASKSAMKFNRRGGGATFRQGAGQNIEQRADKIKQRIESMPTVRVGVPKAAGTYESGVHTATIAAVHEFGSADGRIPERSFLRVGLQESKPEISKLYKKMLSNVMMGKASGAILQRLVGELVVGKVVERISSSIPPKNAKSTIASKKSSTTLIDTGHLRQSITYEVVKEGRTAKNK